MAEIKLTKNELRLQQNRLSQLQKYLPTLQLKKSMLQLEVNQARLEIEEYQKEYRNIYSCLEKNAVLMSDQKLFDFSLAAKVKAVHKSCENIAGVEVPRFKSITFEDFDYNLFDTPPWMDSLVKELRRAASALAKVEVATEKKAALEHELRDVSIRVNLFEKILIPRAVRNIKKIKVFLGDQQLAAVSQAKIAKEKIEALKALAKASTALKGGA